MHQLCRNKGTVDLLSKVITRVNLNIFINPYNGTADYLLKVTLVSSHIYQLSRNKGTGDSLSQLITRVKLNALISFTKAQQIPLKL